MKEVTCESLRADVNAGTWPEGPEVEHHLAACDTCADELLDPGGFASLGELGNAAKRPVGSKDTLAALEAEVEARRAEERGALAWLRERPSEVQRGLAAGLSAVIVLAVWVGARRADWSVYPTGRLVAELAALAVVVLVVSRAALRPISLPERPVAMLVALVVGVLGILGLTGLSPAHAAHPASLEGLGEALVPRAVACLSFGTLCALPVFALLVASDRSSGKIRRTVRLSAVAAAVVGVLALQVHCPIVHVEHLRAGHTTVLVVLLTAGLIYSAFSARSSRASSSRKARSAL